MTYTIQNPMPPLWLMYPYMGQMSAGWRFGYGAEYKWDLMEWLKALSKENAAAWNQMFPPPFFWDDDSSDTRNFCEWLSIGDSEIPVFASKYNVSQLLDSANEKDFIFFLMKKSDEKKAVGTDCFSRWFRSKFSIETQDYWCAEQYIIAEKARVFGDLDTLKNILSAKTTEEIRDRGREVNGFDKTKWNLMSYPVLIYANYQKFIQNPNLMKYLFDTGDKIIVQASQNDYIWGNGLPKEHPDSCNPSAWKGKNLLGFSLMTVRDELRRIGVNYWKVNWTEVYEKYLK